MGDMGGNCRHILFGALVLEWGLPVLHGNVRCGRALAIRPLYPLCHLARPIYDGTARWSLRIRPVDHRCRGKARSGGGAAPPSKLAGEGLFPCLIAGKIGSATRWASVVRRV